MSAFRRRPGALAGPGYSMLLGAGMGRDRQGKGISLELIEFLCKARVYSGAKPGVVPEVGVKGAQFEHCSEGLQYQQT